jgi:hypothetical protein
VFLQWWNTWKLAIIRGICKHLILVGILLIHWIILLPLSDRTCGIIWKRLYSLLGLLHLHESIIVFIQVCHWSSWTSWRTLQATLEFLSSIVEVQGRLLKLKLSFLYGVKHNLFRGIIIQLSGGMCLLNLLD